MGDLLDVAGWMTKEEVKEATQMSDSGITRAVLDGRLRRTHRPVPGRKSEPVYHPEDVVKLKEDKIQVRTPIALKTEPRKRLTDVALRQASVQPINRPSLQPTGHAFGQDQAPILSSVVETSYYEMSALKEKLFLTLSEAAFYTGLSAGFLRKHTKAGCLRVLKGLRGHRFSRHDLETHDFFAD